MIHHSEDFIPRGIRATIEELIQQKTGLIGKHPKYSLSENPPSSFISHDEPPSLRMMRAPVVTI
jgi:hypothetical protein